MALSEEEKKQYEALEKKRKAPDPPPVSRSIVANIDFSDEKQIERAIKHGFLTAEEAKEEKEKAEDDDEDSKTRTRSKDSEKTPRRKGYFDS